MSDYFAFHAQQHTRLPCLSIDPEFAQTHVHLVCDALQQSCPLQQYMNCEIPVIKLVTEKAEESEVKLPMLFGLLKKQESSRKTSISALLTIQSLCLCG